jgi:spermidine synthase
MGGVNFRMSQPGAILVALFCTGFAALGCELCWIRLGTLLFGSTNTAVSTVFAVYFAGLAAGAGLAGTRSQSVADPLKWFGILEIVAAASASATPWLFTAANSTMFIATSWTNGNPALLGLARIAILASIILLPAALCGASLPLVCQHFSRQPADTPRPSPGLLYTFNTLGACAGCLSAGLVFIPGMGLTRTILLNAGVGAAIGAAIVAWRRCEKPHHGPSNGVDFGDSRAPTRSAVPWTRRGLMYALFFFVGFTALGYEVLWTRFLSLIIYNTVYTFTFAMASVLLGIALGSGLLSAGHKSIRNPVVAFAIVSVLGGIIVATTLLLPKSAWAWMAGSHSMVLSAALCLAILLPGSLLSGACFPLALRVVSATEGGGGRDVGGLLASNTVGGIAGALSVGLALLPTAGMHATLVLLTSTSLIVGFVAVAALDQPLGRVRLVGFIALGVLTWSFVVGFSPTRLPADYLHSSGKLVAFREGASSFVAVVQSKASLRLEMDRMWQGNKGRGFQGMAAHLPMHLIPSAQNVLVVGLGSGETASRFLGYGVNLDVVDIEPALHDIVEDYFDGKWLHDPRVRFLNQDGRAFAANSRTTYDVVSIEVGQTFRPQVASFYTVDFYRDVQRLLRPQGLACQFLPIGFFSEMELRSAIGTFLAVFPSATLWYNRNAEFILIGSVAGTPTLTAARLKDLATNPNMDAELRAAGSHSRPGLVAHFLMGPLALARLATDAPLLCDDKPTLEYGAARNRYRPSRHREAFVRNLEPPSKVMDEELAALIAPYLGSVVVLQREYLDGVLER